jgi:hypothetical protein
MLTWWRCAQMLDGGKRFGHSHEQAAKNPNESIHWQVCVCVCLCVYVCMYVCMYVCVYVSIGVCLLGMSVCLSVSSSPRRAAIAGRSLLSLVYMYDVQISPNMLAFPGESHYVCVCSRARASARSRKRCTCACTYSCACVFMCV